MNPKLFRKVSLERLSSPEQLDQAMQVTTPKGWLALITLIVLVVLAIFWGIFGSIPTKVQGMGILIKSGGVFNIVPQSYGQVTDLRVSVGDIVHKGEIVARIGQPDLLDQLRKAKAELQELKNQYKSTSKFGSKDFQLQKDSIEQQRNNIIASIGTFEDQLKWLNEKALLQKDEMAQEQESLGDKIRSYEDQLKWLNEKIQVKKELLEKGLITKQELIKTKEQHAAISIKIKQASAKEKSLREGLTSKKAIEAIKEQRDSISSKIKKARNSLKQLSIKSHQVKNQGNQELLTVQKKINFTERKITSIKEKMNASSKIVSSYTGRVLEVMIDVGDLAKRGAPILTLELMGKEIKDLEAVLYVATTDGKKLKPGMDVQISPTTVKAEEYGFIRGKITSVAEFPATFEGMMRVLNNQNLVQMLSGEGAPLEIYADLTPNDKTISGYKWSSPKGPPLKIYSGTICAVTVIVREQPPISLVIPLMKKHLLGYGD